MSLRNVGSGVAVLQAWGVDVPASIEEQAPLDDPDRFRRQLRDLYISANDVGFWQAALRDPDDPPSTRGSVPRSRSAARS